MKYNDYKQSIVTTDKLVPIANERFFKDFTEHSYLFKVKGKTSWQSTIRLMYQVTGSP